MFLDVYKTRFQWRKIQNRAKPTLAHKIANFDESNNALDVDFRITEVPVIISVVNCPSFLPDAVHPLFKL